MNRRVVVLFLIALLSMSEWSYAYEYLRVQDPRSTWRYGQGTIENATVIVRPKSIYVEHELSLTFSARGLGYTTNDTLEVQLFFDLPKGAIVHDLWLWIDTTYERALIMDIWKASSIYESIVRRRQDPAILFKRSDVNYELRVFPMAGDKSRSIKLYYSIPATWAATATSADLPTNIIRLSKSPVPPLRVFAWLQPGWASPHFTETSDITFQIRDSLGGKVGETLVPGLSLASSLSVEYTSPLQGGVYLRKHEKGTGGVYSLAFLPSQLFGITAKKKVAVLLDYDVTKTALTQPQLLATVKASLQQGLAPGDSFNLLLSHVNIRRASERWIAAGVANIDTVFARLGTTPLGGFSNLIALLSSGIDFVKKNGNNGSLLLVSDADQHGDYQTANQLLPNITALMNPILRVDVADFATQNVRYYYFNSRSYRGNEYLYFNLTRSTGGEFQSLQSGGTLSSLLGKSLSSIGGVFSSFDLYTTVQGGFCYSRLEVLPSSGPQPIDRPILQTGWYQGTFPFVIQAAGMYQNTPFARTVTIPDNAVYAGDSSLHTMWVGNQIARWEASSPTNEMVTTIIDQSVRNRVLSRYTAFLVLEPRDTSRVTGWTETTPNVTGISQRLGDRVSDSVLVAYPNPFNAQTIVRGRVPLGSDPGEIRMEIYNILGQRVRSFDPASVLGEGGRFTVAWNGRDDRGGVLASGTYIFVLTTPGGRQSLKLALLK